MWQIIDYLPSVVFADGQCEQKTELFDIAEYWIVYLDNANVNLVYHISDC